MAKSTLTPEGRARLAASAKRRFTGVPKSADHRAKIGNANLRPFPTEKRCPKCGETKPADMFTRRSTNPRYLKSYCKQCEAVNARADYHENKPQRAARWRQWFLKARYGLDGESFDAMLKAQQGRCAICRKEPTSGPGKRLAIDHDHATGETRAMLCHRCNQGLGMFSDNVTLMKAAIKYLEFFKKETV